MSNTAGSATGRPACDFLRSRGALLGADWYARIQFYSGEDPATDLAPGCAIAYLVRHALAASNPKNQDRTAYRDAAVESHLRLRTAQRRPCDRSAGWRAHHSHCNRTAFPVVMHLISTMRQWEIFSSDALV